MSSPDPARILIVDDSPDDLNYLGYLLKKLGYEPLACDGGAAALATLRSERPDLMIMASDMDAMNGFEVCSQARGLENAAGVPVLFACGMSRPGDKVQALRSGGADYLNKPYISDEVAARIAAHLALGRADSKLAAEAELRFAAEETVRHADQALEKRLEERMAAAAKDMESQQRQLAERNEELAREKARLAEELAQEAQERESMAKAMRDLKSNLDTIQAECEAQTADAAESERLRRERDESRARTQELSQELNQLRLELDNAIRSASAERLNARQRNAAMADRVRELEQEIQALKQQAAQSAPGPNPAAAADAERERQILEQRALEAAKERDSLSAQRDDLLLQRDQLARQRDELAKQRDGLAGQLEAQLAKAGAAPASPPANPGDLSLAQAERERILQVLAVTNWVIEGDKGAAKVLGLKPSTLRFRMRKRGITRPD